MTRAMTLSPPVSRALALALLAIVLLLGFSFVVGPLIDEIGDARSAAARLHDTWAHGTGESWQASAVADGAVRIAGGDVVMSWLSF